VNKYSGLLTIIWVNQVFLAANA